MTDITFKFSTEALAKLDALTARTGSTNYAEVVNASLVLLEEELDRRRAETEPSRFQAAASAVTRVLGYVFVWSAIGFGIFAMGRCSLS